MNLRDLDYVVALADLGHFGEAAQRCNVSQPTLSMQVRKLEEELGVALFERGARRATPTRAGLAVIAQARLVLEQLRRLREIAHTAGEPLGGILKLGVIPTSGPYLLPHILPAVKQRWPELQLHLREARTGQLIERLHRSEIDAAILSPPFDERGLAAADLGEEPFLIALPPGHRLARRDVLTPGELAGETVLTLEDGHCLRAQAAATARAMGLQTHAEIEATSVESLRQMVSVGVGCAIIPAFAGRGPFAQGADIALRRLRAEPSSRRLSLVWRRSWPRPDAMAELAEALRSAIFAIPTT